MRKTINSNLSELMVRVRLIFKIISFHMYTQNNRYSGLISRYSTMGQASYIFNSDIYLFIKNI